MLRPLLLSGAILASAAALAQDKYFARVSGHQEVPSVASLAEAGVQVQLSNDTLFVIAADTLTLTSAIDPAIGVHIHTGYAGENGPVAIGLPYDNLEVGAVRTALATLRDTAIKLPRADVDALRAALDAGRAYINIHTFNYPGGEVRGQFFPGFSNGLEAAYDAMLYGDDENPAVLTEGMGGVIVEVTADSMFFSGAFSLESPLAPVGQTGAHVHIGSFGQNGSILLALNPTFDDETLTGEFRRRDNGFAYDLAVIEAINIRRAYVNIHSEAHPTGEIRGQIVPFGTNLYKSHVSQTAPRAYPNPEAYLRVLAEKVFDNDQIRYSGSWSGWGDEIGERGLQIAATVNNPFVANSLSGVLLQVSPEEGGGSGTVILSGLPEQSPAQIEGLFLRSFTSVQWRGDDGEGGIDIPYADMMYHECKRVFAADFTGSQEVPAVPSGGGGRILTEYYGNRADVLGSVTGLQSPVDASIQDGFHIHDAMVGRNSGIVSGVPYTAGPGGTSLFFIPNTAQVNLNDELAADMKARGLYYNVHTTGYPMGEVRAQILPQANTVLHALAEPAQARPGGVVTEASGALLVELYNGRATASGTFDGLRDYLPMAAAGSGAHLHSGYPRRHGPGGLLAHHRRRGRRRERGLRRGRQHLRRVRRRPRQYGVAGVLPQHPLRGRTLRRDPRASRPPWPTSWSTPASAPRSRSPTPGRPPRAWASATSTARSTTRPSSTTAPSPRSTPTSIPASWAGPTSTSARWPRPGASSSPSTSACPRATATTTATRRPSCSPRPTPSNYSGANSGPWASAGSTLTSTPTTRRAGPSAGRCCCRSTSTRTPCGPSSSPRTGPP